MSKSPKDTKGPVVKTGPTRGQNRSRNKDGQWRSKRNDAGKSRGKGNKSTGKSGCFLTTAACQQRGLPDSCRELEAMRGFRDRVLLMETEGRRLVEHYYRIAPDLVPLLHDPAVSMRVWQAIRSTASQIESGRFSDAMLSYRGMTELLLRLKRRNVRC